MDDRNMAHKAANAVFRDSDASLKPRSKDERIKDLSVRGAHHDRVGPTNTPSTSSPSNGQPPKLRRGNPDNSIVREAEREHKVRYDKLPKPDIQQGVRAPNVPARDSTERTKMNGKEDEKGESVPDDDAFNPADLFYVVMGVTGAGKSTLISLLSDDNIEVGHDLQSSKYTRFDQPSMANSSRNQACQ
jgi:hypothetical protein